MVSIDVITVCTVCSICGFTQTTENNIAIAVTAIAIFTALCPLPDFLLCLKHPSIAFLFAKMDTTHIVIVASSQTILSFSNVQPRYKKSTATPQNIPSIVTNPFAYVLDIFLFFTPAAASINAPANNGTKKNK